MTIVSALSCRLCRCFFLVDCAGTAVWSLLSVLLLLVSLHGICRVVVDGERGISLCRSSVETLRSITLSLHHSVALSLYTTTCGPHTTCQRRQKKPDFPAVFLLARFAAVQIPPPSLLAHTHLENRDGTARQHFGVLLVNCGFRCNVGLLYSRLANER